MSPADPNPFEAPSAPLRPRGERADRVPSAPGTGVAALLASLHPPAFLGTSYAAWLVAWAALGHPPRPSVDDPMQIGPAVTLLCWGSMFLLVLAPGSLLASLGLWGWVLWEEGRHARRRVFRVLLPPLIWIAAIRSTWDDPGRVFEWLGD